MENKLIPGILIGAIIGGAATLADKSTRNSLTQSFKDVKEGNRSRKPSKINSIKDEVMDWKATGTDTKDRDHETTAILG